ncbi:hypothetical protein GJAV_G00114600 [Gymnothorax javanicus]|nr:hypothetical protein GJAV_G00114600 [Gymnothorax javanicus]
MPDCKTLPLLWKGGAISCVPEEDDVLQTWSFTSTTEEMVMNVADITSPFWMSFVLHHCILSPGCFTGKCTI